jgi:hypothetical protein
LLKDHDVHYFSTRTFRKAALVERFNRTLKTRMWKYFTENRTKVWVDVLPNLVRSYNNTTHSERFERFRVWAKENMGALAAIAISIAGIITTVVVAGKKAIMGASSGLGAAGKALAKFAKAALPILVPILN